ncbi:MAG: N-acetylmuramoyl-L-alanine amidase [Patescibacteria group bacterium]|nr:N-acetylmuramoyl-L-alanine amidase [Patescibacteria group bacterium]
MKKIIYSFFVLIIITSLSLLANHTKLSFSNVKDFLASVFFIDSITVDDLHNRYNNGKVKILIVPGHDDKYFGTEFRGVREADLTADLGQELLAKLKNNSRFEVYITRDRNGYLPEFQNYFDTQKGEVLKFQKSQKAIMNAYMKKGQVDGVFGVQHNNAPSVVVYRLYAINKWANDNKMDLVIHLHFNDYAGRKAGQVGKYSGFSIYIPEYQYSNAKASVAVAYNVFMSLLNHSKSSNLPIESQGIIPDQDLIAIGSNNSLDSAGFLIEYGYIYEPRVPTFAEDTYQGLLNFFENR